MIVDLCAYFGKWPYWPTDVSSAPEVVKELDHCGIHRAAICSTRGLFVGWEEGNRETEEAVRQFPRRLLSFACLGPTELSHTMRGNVLDLAQCRARGFLGVRLYPQHHTYQPLYEPFVDQILEESAMRNWPVMLPLRVMMNWGLPALRLDSMVTLVERHPRATWVLSGMNYFQELRAAVWLMRRFPSVHLETSCVQGFHAVAKLVEECGADHLLFGSGLPLQNGAANLQKILHARIDERAREKILGGNACRLLNLQAP